MDFFREDDADCEKTTFQYNGERYDPTLSGGSVYLTTITRARLNDLVRRLNIVISNAIKTVNEERGSENVHFVDMQDNWVQGEHGWCEQGDFHEPDASRDDTWFFLSGWNDVPIEGDGHVDLLHDVADVKSLRKLACFYGAFLTSPTHI